MSHPSLFSSEGWEGTNLHHHYPNGRGTVRQLTNSAGQVTDSYDYDAFGNLVNQTGTTPNLYLYRGEQWDPDLSLYYLRHRYYNPLTDRFLSRDPKSGHIGIPRTLHKYLYASADGVNRVDPRGTEDFVEEENDEADVSVEEDAGLDAIAQRVKCILNTAADVLAAVDQAQSALGEGGAILSIAGDLETCTAEDEVKPGGEPEPGTCPLCFAAGTPVHTDHGDVPIENIHEGDEVESRNRATGKLEYQRVTALTPLHKDALLEVRIEGERTPLRPSTSHPFWVKRGDAPAGWMNSGQMRAGDFVQSIAGAWRRVVAITPLPGQQTVYNFTVDLNHDYFVGETGFLVHNAGGCGCNGNSRNSPRPATLYRLVDGFGNFLKWGISQNPATRYSGTFLNGLGGEGGMAISEMTGSRSEMLDMERWLVERDPGPLNNEPWAGCMWTPPIAME